MTKTRNLSELEYRVQEIEDMIADGTIGGGGGGGGDCQLPFVKADGSIDNIPLTCTGSGGGAAGVSQLIAGDGIAVSPDSGVGVVTVVSTATLDFVLTTGEEKPIPLS
jgi:hypothetical protein